MPSLYGYIARCAKLILLLLAVIVLHQGTQDISDTDEEIAPEDYKGLLDYRVARLKNVCMQYENNMSTEHSSLYHRQESFTKASPLI